MQQKKNKLICAILASVIYGQAVGSQQELGEETYTSKSQIKTQETQEDVSSSLPKTLEIPQEPLEPKKQMIPDLGTNSSPSKDHLQRNALEPQEEEESIEDIALNGNKLVPSDGEPLEGKSSQGLFWFFGVFVVLLFVTFVFT